MVDWKSQEVILKCARAAGIILQCSFSIYAWEWVNTLDHDWAILRGKRKFGVGTALYVVCRYLALIALILAVRTVNSMDASVNCLNWLYATNAVAFSAVACTSGLLYMRVIAVSKNNKYLLWGLGAGYAVVWAFVGIAIQKTQVVYVAPLYICAKINVHRYVNNMIYAFVYDTVCLGLMLFYLLRMRHGGMLWKYLVQQGVAYAAGICSAYLFVIIMVSIDLNDAMSDVGMAVILTSSTIFATRMQRGLAEFFERPGDVSRPSQFSSNGAIGSKQPPTHLQSGTSGAQPILRNGQAVNGSVQVTVDIHRDESPHSDWKDTSRSFVPDDYELGKVPQPQHNRSDSWNQRGMR